MKVVKSFAILYLTNKNFNDDFIFKKGRYKFSFWIFEFKQRN